MWLEMKISVRARRFVAISIVPLWILGVGIICKLAGIPWLADGNSLRGLITDVSAVLLMSLALSLNLRCHRFDFSLGAVAALSPIFAVCICPDSSVNLIISVFFGGLLSLCVGGVGILSGLKSEYISLCFALIFEGAASALGDRAVGDWKNTGGTTAVMLASVALVLIALLVRKTPFGYDYRAICNGESIARAAGVGVDLNSLLVFVISGMLMGGAGMLLAGDNGQGLGGINFFSVRILLYAIPPIFVGRFLERLCEPHLSLAIGTIVVVAVYSAMETAGLAFPIRIIVSAVAVLLLLVYLSNERKILQGLRRE